MRSSFGMFSYKDVMSVLTKKALDGRGRSFLIRLRKCFVSLM